MTTLLELEKVANKLAKDRMDLLNKLMEDPGVKYVIQWYADQAVEAATLKWRKREFRRYNRRTQS